VSLLDPPDLHEIQIEWVVYHITCGYVTCVAECRGSLRMMADCRGDLRMMADCRSSLRNHENPAQVSRNHTLYDIPPIIFVLQVT
jgi:hypothetical protein